MTRPIPRARGPSRPITRRAVQPVRPGRRDAGPRACSTSSAGRRGCCCWAWSSSTSWSWPAAGCRPPGPGARLRAGAGRRRGLDPQARARPQAQPAGRQRRIRRGAGRDLPGQPFRPVGMLLILVSAGAFRPGALPRRAVRLAVPGGLAWVRCRLDRRRRRQGPGAAAGRRACMRSRGSELRRSRRCRPLPGLPARPAAHRRDQRADVGSRRPVRS